MPLFIRWILICSLFFSWQAMASSEILVGAKPEAPVEEAKAEVVPTGLSSPRATMATFLAAMNDIKRGDAARIKQAIETLDLSAINALVKTERGEHLAWQLLEVLDRTQVIKLEKIPTNEATGVWLFHAYEKGAIRIARQNNGIWLFDAASLRQLPAIFEELSSKKAVTELTDNSAYLPWDIRIRNLLPTPLTSTFFLIENWRWLALLIVITLGVLADWVVSFVLRRFMAGWLKRRPNDYQGVADRENRLRPLGMLVMALVWWTGINMLGLPELALVILLVAVKALASASAVWAAYRVVDLLAAWLMARAQATNNKIDDVLVPLVPRTLKIFVTAVGIIFIADNLNIDITGLLAGLGLGGLAFALAAKDMVQNLFGSITVLLDRTFVVGDWIIVDGCEGSVEKMGFRSTRVRTFYNSLVTIPNAKFITAEVDNMGERRYRRYKAKFGLAYDTSPEHIEAFCEGVREIVRQHPYMRKDYFHVYLNDLGASSLDILIYVFWETPDWSTELRERQRFLLDCLRLAKKLGVEYAFPTQTLYLRNEESVMEDGSASLKEDARKQGKDAAQQIVKENTGLNIKPPPVNFRDI